MKKTVEARAASFIEKVAQKLAQKGISDLAPHLENAVADLPAGELQSAIASDLPRFASRLRECIAEIHPAPASSAKSLDSLLRASQAPLLTDEAFHKAAEALLAGAQKLSPGNEKMPEWIASCRRLLVSRVHAPLSLWWIYSALELYNASAFEGKGGEQRCMHVVSIARSLLDHLKNLTIGRCNSFTSVAVLAPVVAALLEAGCILKSVPEKSSKPWRRTLKSFRETCREVLTYINLHATRKNQDLAQTEKKDEMILRGLVLAATGLSRVTGMKEFAGRKGAEKNFPLLAHEMNLLEISDMQTCASLVSGEAFLLNIMVKILEHRSQRRGDSSFESPDFCDELRFLAVHNIDLLCDLLIDAKLSVEPLLNTDEEVFLRGILYDVITLDSPWPQDKYPVYMKKLILARRAIQFYRLNGARTKALKLASRVSLWDVPAGFSEWLKSLNFKRKPSEQTLNDSRALIGWLTDKAEDGHIASILAECTKRKFKRQKQKVTEELEGTFIVDTKGEPSALEALNKEFLEACEAMKKSPQVKHQPREALGSESDDESDEEVVEKVSGARGEKLEKDAQVLDSGAGEKEDNSTKAGAGVGVGKAEEAPDEEFIGAHDSRGEDKEKGGKDVDMPDAEELSQNEETATDDVLSGCDKPGDMKPGDDAVGNEGHLAARLDENTRNNAVGAGGNEEKDEADDGGEEEDDDEDDGGAKALGRRDVVSDAARDAAESLRDEVQTVLEEAAASKAPAAEAPATGAADTPVLVDSDSRLSSEGGEEMTDEAPAVEGEKNLIILAETPPQNEPSDAGTTEAGAPEGDKQLSDEATTVPDAEAGGALEQRERETTADATTIEDDDVILLEPEPPAEKKNPGRKKKFKEPPQTPKPDAPGDQTPSMRFTRSGRKYGDAEAVAATSRKKRKTTKSD